MPAKLVVENFSSVIDSDLDKCLAFTVDNVGDVDVELGFDESGATVAMPAGTSRTYDFIGDYYTGRINGKFAKPDPHEEAGQKRRIIVTKTVFFCK